MNANEDDAPFSDVAGFWNAEFYEYGFQQLARDSFQIAAGYSVGSFFQSVQGTNELVPTGRRDRLLPPSLLPNCCD